MRRAKHGIVERKDGTVWRKATIYFTPDAYRELEQFCITADLELSDVVAKATSEYLERMRRAASQLPTVRNPRTPEGLRSPRRSEVPRLEESRSTRSRSLRSRSP